MSLQMTNKDYVNILKFYKKNIPKSKRILKMTAEKLLNDKLCKCIKKVDPVNESKSIAICTSSIFNRKALKRGKFTCKKKRSLIVGKSDSNNNNNVNKIKKTNQTKKRH
jgi:hypothetical protein